MTDLSGRQDTGTTKYKLFLDITPTKFKISMHIIIVVNKNLQISNVIFATWEILWSNILFSA